MSATSLFKYLYSAHLSSPQLNRVLYRAIRREKICRIVELGIGCGSRAARMIEIAQRYSQQEEISYTGIDLFEACEDRSSAISLKEAYQALRPLGSKIQLIPGDPFMALSQAANRLLQSDLVVISADHHPESMEKAWFYVPRMLHRQSLVYLEESRDGKARFRQICQEEVEKFAQKYKPSLRRAA